jgi:hypothetical protein
MVINRTLAIIGKSPRNPVMFVRDSPCFWERRGSWRAMEALQ